MGCSPVPVGAGPVSDLIGADGPAARVSGERRERLEEAHEIDHAFIPAGAPFAACAACGMRENRHPKPVPQALVVFLYLLMRDEVPTGTVMRLVEEAALHASKPAMAGERETGLVFSAEELEALALRYANGLV